MRRTVPFREENRLAGVLTIRKFRDGVLVWESEPIPNKIVMSSGYGRNLIVRQLAGDQTYPLTIDSASLGTSNAARADGQTDLVAPTVTGIPITNKTAVDGTLSVDVFVGDANLSNGTYREFGLFCALRMFATIAMTSDYVKAPGDDTLFTYQLTYNG